MSFCNTVCCFCCQSETHTPPPRCSMTKTDLWQITYHHVNALAELAWRKYDLQRLRQLEALISSALFFPLCLSAALWLRDLLTPPPAFEPKSCFWDLKWSDWWKLCHFSTSLSHWVSWGVICKLELGMLLLGALLWCQLWAKIRVTAKWQWKLASEAVASCVPRTAKAWRAELVICYYRSTQEVPWGPAWCHGHQEFQTLVLTADLNGHLTIFVIHTCLTLSSANCQICKTNGKLLLNMHTKICPEDIVISLHALKEWL